MLIKEIVENIAEIKQELDEVNDGVSATKEVAQLVIGSVQEHFNQAGATQSIDEKLQTLVNSSQACVKIVEDFHNELEKKVQDFQLQVSTLESLLDRVKKFEQDAGEQTVSIEEEGEKKGDESEGTIG